MTDITLYQLYDAVIRTNEMNDDCLTDLHIAPHGLVVDVKRNGVSTRWIIPQSEFTTLQHVEKCITMTIERAREK